MSTGIILEELISLAREDQALIDWWPCEYKRDRTVHMTSVNGISSVVVHVSRRVPFISVYISVRRVSILMIKRKWLLVTSIIGAMLQAYTRR